MNEKRTIEIELSKYEELLRDRNTLEVLRRYVENTYVINSGAIEAILGIEKHVGKNQTDINLIPIE